MVRYLLPPILEVHALFSLEGTCSCFGLAFIVSSSAPPRFLVPISPPPTCFHFTWQQLSSILSAVVVPRVRISRESGVSLGTRGFGHCWAAGLGMSVVSSFVVQGPGIDKHGERGREGGREGWGVSLRGAQIERWGGWGAEVWSLRDSRSERQRM